MYHFVMYIYLYALLVTIRFWFTDPVFSIMAQRPLEQHRARSSSKRMVKYPTSRDLETRYLIVTKYFGDGDTEEEIADNLDVGIGSVSK